MEVKYELGIIDNALTHAAQQGLELEVIWSAFKAIQENPSLTIEEALEVGMGEWDI